jgi:hypothetical protein
MDGPEDFRGSINSVKERGSHGALRSQLMRNIENGRSRNRLRRSETLEMNVKGFRFDPESLHAERASRADEAHQDHGRCAQVRSRVGDQEAEGRGQSGVALI